MHEVFHALGVLETRQVDDEADRYGLWAARKNILPALLRTARDVYVAGSVVPDEEERAMELADALMQLALDAGGSVSGEHGIGTEKLHGMCWQLSADELDVFRQIQAVFDPKGILNPGKAVPTLHRCAEPGGMHIRNGEMPHADLPRF